MPPPSGKLFLPPATGGFTLSRRGHVQSWPRRFAIDVHTSEDVIKLKAATKLFAGLQMAKRLAAEGNRVAQLSLEYCANEQAYVNVHLKYANNQVLANVRTRDDLAGLFSPPLRLEDCPFFCAYLKLLPLTPSRSMGSTVLGEFEQHPTAAKTWQRTHVHHADHALLCPRVVTVGLFGSCNGITCNGLRRSVNHE